MFRTGNQRGHRRVRREVDGQLRELPIGPGRLGAVDAIAELLERQAAADHRIPEQDDAPLALLVARADRRKIGPVVHAGPR
jgi:hypothetical protein